MVAQRAGEGWVEEEPAWRRDVALELWVDVERSPVLLRLAGTLDAATSRSLVSVVADLIDDGHRDFDLGTDALHAVGPGGSAALVAIEGMVERSGGKVRLVAATTGDLADHDWTTGPGPAALAGR